MKIIDSAIRFSTEHFQSQKAEKEERLRFWVGASPPNREADRRQAGSSNQPVADQIQISAPARKKAQSLEKEGEASDPNQALSLKILIVEKMVKLFTGREVKIVSPNLADPGGASTNLPAEENASPPGRTEAVRQGWGLEYTRITSQVEEEYLDLRAAGQAATTDGRVFQFQTDLRLERRFFNRDTFSLQAGDAVKTDPLVINWDGAGVRLSETRTPFDLNGDGTLESIPGLAGGNGFLALDINRDGEINDGRELFGPQTGNGFTELARYDQDGSSWIDEGDPIFSQLRIWTKGLDGPDRLSPLADRGIGAISLSHGDSPFQLKSTANESLGEVVRTGIYLDEEGKSGLVQQINLTT